ncbi:MAG: glycosyltransferase, partial [Candidatus Nanopelagicales bacterium]
QLLLDCFIGLRQSVDLSRETEAEIVHALSQGRTVPRLRRALRSRRVIHRIEATTQLSYLPSQQTTDALKAAFVAERKPTVKYRMAVALHEIDPDDSVALLLASLDQAGTWYFDRVAPLLLDSGRPFFEASRRLIGSGDPRMQRLLIEFAGRYPERSLRNYLLSKVDDTVPGIAVAAATSLAQLYPETLASDAFLHHANDEVRRIAIGSLANAHSRAALEQLLNLLKEEFPQTVSATRSPSSSIAAINIGSAIAEMLRREPGLVPMVAQAFAASDDPMIRSTLADLLALRIQFYFVLLLGRYRDHAHEVIKAVLAQGKASETIAFLNRNRNVELENEILACAREALTLDRGLEDEFRHYLDPRILAKLDLEPLEFAKEIRIEPREKHKLAYLTVLLVIAVLGIPAVFIVQHHGLLGQTSPVDLLRQYVVEWNYLMIFYSGGLQLITMIILGFAIVGARKQTRSWQAKPMSLLYRPGALPSVSIIAPAFNEEATIVESVNSLLSINYPNFELIVVNDGSADATMNRLIEIFELDKIDRVVDAQLATRPIRGIYHNPLYPQLLIVDKANGGKADSLNAGINVSKKEYFCGIDADSLLESDSMLKVAAGSLDSEAEMVASGGNIYPINGCTVDHGAITKIALPKSSLARFQTVEYIRAFMAGRIGWSYLNSLLIISGAFGLFKRDRVIEVGGYLTEAGRYGKDTVGEDMELVVRLRRDMVEAGVPHTINYAANANCWTEVPEDLSVLHRQRDRWQRGLIDIEFFHRKLILNPRYRTVGLLGMPYFFIFETLGPLIEVQGYLMIVLGAMTGVINLTIALALFLTIILWGVLVSMISLYLTEKETNYFARGEVGTLIWYAIIENFGYRQLASFWRVSGYFSAMRKPKGWGKMSRKGFATTT